MTISFSGLASGLDTSSWVESLVKLKQAKIDTLQEEKEGIELTKDTLESIKSFFSSFRSVLEKVTDSKFGIAATDLFAQNLATSANLDVLTATATTEAEESTYNVLVDQLATNSAAKSNYSYMTTIIQTTTATADSKLINLGVKTGNIGVKVNGIERGIEITDTDTISSFIEKLQNIGVNASFNDKTGIFSMDISANDINDIDKTGIVNAFKLSGVNEGYTSNSLKITSTDTIYSAATNDTKLSELGAKAGTLIIKANDTEYKITIDENTTLGEFIKKLNDNKISANLDKTGILTIVDANITNEGTTNIKNALGLELDIYSNTQKSNDLSHKTVITQTTTATSDTLLKDLGVEIKDNQTVIVKNSNNEYTTITVGTSTTLGDLLTKISNAGLYAAIDTEGRVEISGGTITGGTFNAIKALGLTSEPYSAITTGKPLTETVRKAELVTLETKLVDEMKVRAGYIEVTDNDGNKFYEKIYHGQTIADFMSDMGNLGIYTKLRDDGVLEITGGAFATLSDDKVKELIANGTIRETDDRYKQGTDLLTCLYGSPVISTDQITVASTYSKSRALTKKVVNTIAASLTSTLGNLSLQADGTAIFDVRGDKRTIEVAKTDTLQNLMDKLKNVGIASSWNSNTQQFTIENATLEGGTANLGSVLNLTKTISGKYVTSNSLNKLETVTIDATRSTTLNKYGISNSMSDADRTIKLFDNNAKLVGSLTVIEATTIGDVLDFVNKNSGMKASIVDGILQIEGGYIENAALEKSMGLTTENKSSFALGSIMTVTTVAAVTGSTTLGQIISTLGTADAVKDGYSLTFNSKSLSVSATTTLDQLISQIFTNGGSASLDNTGRLSISGGVVAGSVATALGITTVSTTTAVSATGKTLVTTKTEYADLETKLSDVGVSDNSTIILHNKLGSAYKTITVNGSTTVKDVFASLKAEGIDGTISNGVISLKSAEYKYITGTVATALGIGTQTVTDVVNTSVYSTSKVTFTGSGLADGTTAIGSIVGVTADNNKLTIKDKNNNTIGTVTVTNTTTLDELFGMLAKFDITGKVSDGVISFDSPSGNYVQGGLVNSWGMTATTIIVTTTVGKTSTSTAAISHTVTKTADISSTLAQLGINKGNTLIVHKTDGGTATVTVSGSTTLDSLFDSLDNYGVQGVVAEGIITFTSVDGAYLTDASGSDLLSKLGVTTAFETVTTTMTKGTTKTSGTLTYTGTESATLANKVLSYTTLTTNQTITVKDSDGNTKGSVTVTANTTFNDLFKALDDLGIQGTMEDGMVTLTSNNGAYATGGVLTALGIEAKTATITTTVGKTTTSTAAISHTVTKTADISSTLAQLGINKGNTLIVHKTDGGTATVTVSGSTTLDSLFDTLDNHGVQGVVAEGIITFTSVDGAYLTDASGSDLLSKLGVTTALETITTTTTKGTTKTSGTLTYTGTESATLANKVLSYTTLTTDQTVTVKDSDGNTKGSVTVTANTTFSDLFKALDDLGIQGTMEDGMVTLTSNNGFYATGGVLTALGIEAKTMLTTITVGTTNTSTAAVTYTDTFVATESTLVGSCIDLSTGNTLVVNSGQKKALTTITVSATTTFKDLMNTLKENGIDSTFINGVLSLKSENGNYVTGDVADKLGISLIKFIGMGTGGGSGSSTIEGGSTVDTALIGQLAYFLGNTTTINIKSSDGSVIATQEFYGYAKIDDLIRFFTKYGISAEVRDNILCLDNNNGIYAEDATTGGFLTQIGVGVTTKAVATSFLSVITNTTASNAIAISSITSLVVGSTYSISSASDLTKLASLVNSGQSTTGTTFILTNDIDWANTPGYTPIGNNDNKFMGVFYGNGHVIKNFSISATRTTGTTGETDAGLFGYIGNTARIIDLGVENAYVYSQNDKAGVIAANAEGTITNCFVKGNITVKGERATGGIVGKTTNTIANCYTSGIINITSDTYCAGGLVGESSSVISNCFVQGNANIQGSYYVGGLVGSFASSATEVAVKGTINVSGSRDVGGYFGCAENVSNIVADFAGSVKGESNVGGIVGSASVVSNCTASINVIGKEGYRAVSDTSTYGKVGGIAGSASQISQCSYNGTITANGTQGCGGIAGAVNIISNCYSSGLITGAGASIGGIAGTIDNSSYGSALRASATTSYSSMNINLNGTYKRENREYDSSNGWTTSIVDAASSLVGGFAGASYGEISNCYATGNITTNGNMNIAGFAGLLQANSGSSTIQNCYATGNINISSSQGSNIGGFAGAIGVASSVYTIKVTNSYATGNVTGAADSDSSAAFVGNASTSSHIEISQCYASGIASSGYAFGGRNVYTAAYSSIIIRATYGNSANTKDVANCTKLTLAQLQNQATMTANGFTTAKGWSYETGKTPMLKYTAGKTSTTNEQKYTYAAVRLPVNTNSKNLQEIIDNGISGGNDDGGLAVEDDILGNVISFPEKYLTINIKSSDGSIIKSLSFNQYSRISELLKFFNDNGINSYMKDGVLYLNNDNGFYAEDAIAGGVLSQMKISTTTKAVATSFLSVITNTTASNAIAISSITSLVVGSTYSISSASDLTKLASLVNSGQSTTGTTFILTNDIDWANTPGYTPIGNNDNKFMGVFYGNGHVIKNFSISATRTTGTTGETDAGLFGYIGNTARIIDLGVENAYVYSQNDKAGVIAANAEGTITNCFVKGNITVKGERATGGIVGKTTNTIANCYTSGIINITSDTYCAGGLVGESSSVISNCFVQGNANIQGSYYVGGLVGSFASSATEVAVKGTINVSGSRDVGGYFGCAENVSNIVADFAGSVKGESNVGGIVGSASVVSNCTASINVIGKEGYRAVSDTSTYGKVGGIAGSASQISQCSYNGTITANGTQGCGGIAGAVNIISNCYSSGLITGAGASIGGIAGTIDNSSYGSALRASATTSYSSMNINLNGTYKRENREYDSSNGWTTSIVDAASSLVGGFAGASYGEISNCYATGNITTNGNMNIAGFAGLLQANSGSSTIQNCYATGNINISSSQGSNIGGFAGAIGVASSVYTIKVTNSYATGNVTGAADSDSSAAFVGNASTSSHIEISQCYASGIASSGYAFGGRNVYTAAYSSIIIRATYGNSANTKDVANCTKLTLAQLQNQATMTANGFTTAKGWSYETGKTPMLKYTAGKTSTTNEQKYTYASVRLPVNTNSMILYRTYTPGSGGSGGGGGGSVVVTILTNSTSDQQSYKSLTQMTTETLFKMLGFSDSTTGYITVVSGGTQHVVTIKSSDTIDDILTTLAGFSVSGSVHDGKLTLTGTSNGYIAGASDDVKTALKIETGSEKTYTTSTKTSGFNTVSNKLSKSVTYKADGDTLLSKINKTGTISGVYNGQAFSVTASAGKTIGDVLTELAGYGISGSIENGVIKLVGTPEGYITNAGGAFGLTGSAYTTTTTSKVNGVNSNSNKQVYSSTVSINPTSTFSQLGMSANGTMVINNNGTLYTVTAKTTDTLDSLLTTIAGLGIAGSIADGKLTLAGTADGFISSMSDNLKTALKLNIGSGNSYSTSTKTTGFNTVSNKLSKSVTYKADGDTLLSKINKTGTISGVYNGQAFSVTASAGKTIGDVLTELAGYGISGSIENGVIKLVGTPEGYITNAGGAFGLTGSAYTTTTTSKVNGVNSNSNKQVYSSTVSINPTSTFSQLGMSANGTMVINNNGTLYTVTAKTTDTLDSLLTTIAGLGIAGSIADGKLTLAGTADGFISSMSDNLKTALKLNIGSGNSYSTSTKTICSQGTSGNLGYVSTNAALTSSTKLSNINGFANGNGKLVIHQTNGQFVTISIDATKTLGEFFTDISRYGLVGNINDGKVSIEGIGNVYMQAIDGGSNILTALKLSNVIQNVQTVTVNRTSNILSHTVTIAASGTTQLGNLADSLGNTIGSGNGTIILSTTSNAGNQNVTLTFDRTKSIYDVIDALAGYGINASLDALGKFSINSSTLTDFSISGNLGTLLMGTYKKVYGKGETFNISTNLVEKTTLPMSKTDLLSSFGITNGNILITQQGVNYTVNIDTTQVKTVADFMKLLSSYGFESDIDSAGRLYVSGIGKSYLSSISGGSNILDKFGLTNWSLGDVKQESKHLGDYKVNNITCSLDTKLNQLTDASGSNLGISSGNIYVYQDGTRYLVNIDNNDTLQTLSAKLAQYGITMGLSTEGKLYFDGTNDSYMTTDGITNGASNILNRLNIAGNWSTRYDSTSENLSYTTKSNNIVSGSTKLADLQDSDGKNLGITTGAFYVYNSGSRSTESITADMTVNDLMATLAKHGLVADIAEDGSISIGAYNNTYLATSALTSDNSNIVSKLFSEWNFVNIYTSKGLDIPVDEVKSINRNTKLSAINEGKYQDGYITVVKDGVQTNIKLTSDDTVGTLMDELSLYGFESVINEKGQLLIKNTGNSLLQKYTGTEQASNALELLGIDLNNWIQTSSYKSDTLKVTQTSTIDSDVTRDTLLSELGVTTGEYNIFKNGVKYTAYISTGETMGSFLDTLKSFGIETSLVSDGDSSILTIIGSGDTYIAKSNSTTGASNVVEKLFANNDKYSSFRYKGLEQTSETVTHFTAATKDTLLSEFNKKDGSNTLTSVGDLSVTVNGETATIKIEADETFGSLIEKFKALGLEASISSTGQLMIQSGYNTFTINSDGTNSNLLSNVGLVYHNDLGGYVASTDTLKATTTTIEEKTFSVANYADYNTKMSLMNISSGTLSVYLNGQKATIKIDKNQTFGDLRSLVSTEFADVDLTFEDGYIKFYSKKDGDKVEVGATTDTSNFAAITGITSDGNGAVKSARELFCVNNSSVITNSGLFRKGDVTKGTFTVGNATFTIDDKTTISDIISQINSNDEANATAYWDSIEGNFVIKSRTTGSALINIEAGTSNFTDIMGFTNSEWAADGSLNVTRMNTASQEVGNNAKFSINGTYYTSTSNNITSDVSRIKGLTINLKGLTDGSAITLTVERDKETLANAVSDIVDSYNELMDNVDKEITKEGKLKDQSTLKLIRNQLRSLMTSSDAGTTIFRNLDAIGIKVEAASGNNISTSGLTTLTFDKDKFFEAFKSDQNAVKDLLIGSANNTGIFTKVENLVESSLKSVSGYFESADKSYQKQINKLDNKIEKQKTALERYRAQLESKFSSMDILIANMQQQYSSFLRT